MFAPIEATSFIIHIHKPRPDINGNSHHIYIGYTKEYSVTGVWESIGNSTQEVPKALHWMLPNAPTFAVTPDEYNWWWTKAA